ncbi:GTPase IMAP family member 6 [Bubalus kerabau]|uniref:GTPase IMAP family member 6 n=1 Tax=Bubalus carabanensis TaxID=3119969 RepID=UPI00244ED085|nr:GTPase IMAP family member 6 [Bubalus carabanensis]
MSSMCVYVWGTVTDLLHSACSVLALKGETESSGEHTAPGEARHRHSSCPTDSRAIEEEEFEILLSDEPEEGASQDPSPDGSGGRWGDEGTPQTLRLILVGKSGSGKSATGNSILGRRVFESKLSARPVTQAFQQGRRAWEGRELQVIDTPDILSPWAAGRATAQGVGEAGAGSPPEPYAVLLVTQLGRFTEEDQQVARRLEEVFGKGILARTVLVFTRKEDLDGGSLETYLEKTDNQALAKLHKDCLSRHCGFNNKGDGAEQEAQLRELMQHFKGVPAFSPPAAPQPRAAPRESWGLWWLGAKEGHRDQAWLWGLHRILKEPEQAGRQLPLSAPI